MINYIKLKKAIKDTKKNLLICFSFVFILTIVLLILESANDRYKASFLIHNEAFIKVSNTIIEKNLNLNIKNKNLLLDDKKTIQSINYLKMIGINEIEINKISLNIEDVGHFQVVMFFKNILPNHEDLNISKNIILDLIKKQGGFAEEIDFKIESTKKIIANLENLIDQTTTRNKLINEKLIESKTSIIGLTDSNSNLSGILQEIHHQEKRLNQLIMMEKDIALTELIMTKMDKRYVLIVISSLFVFTVLFLLVVSTYFNTQRY